MSELKTCHFCGNPFSRDVRNSRAYFARAKYCSQACAGKGNTRRLNTIRPPMSEKFEQQVCKSDGCWEWTGIKDKDGYGLFPYNKKLLRANKIALELDGRKVPDGMYACHHCDNSGCVRPDHLYPGTPTQNMADAIIRRRLNPRTKLSADQVLAIRREIGTHEQIAETYGVSRASVSMIRAHKTWRNLP